jgi:cell division protease FtsH
VGPINLGRQNGNVFLGEEIVKSHEHSEGLSSLVDEEIKSIIEHCYEKAFGILKKNKERLDKVANKLLDVEVLEGEQLDQLLEQGAPGVV